MAGTIFLALAAIWFNGLVLSLPLFAAFAAFQYAHYRGAKRELAAFNKPPTARLLR